MDKNAKRLVGSNKFAPEDFDFDIGHYKADRYNKCLDMLFGCDKWLTMLDKRHKLCNAVGKPGSNPALVFNGIKKLDRQMADEIYSSLAIQCIIGDNDINDGLIDNAHDFFAQFDGDEEKKKIVEDIMSYLGKIYMVSDILTGYVREVESKLKKLDDSQIFITMHSMSQSLSNLQYLVSGAHSKHSEEQDELFNEYCDSIEAYIDKRHAVLDRKMEAMASKADKAKEKERIEKRKASGRNVKKQI